MNNRAVTTQMYNSNLIILFLKNNIIQQPELSCKGPPLCHGRSKPASHVTHLVGREGPRRNSRCSTGQSVWEGDVNKVNTAAMSSCDMLLRCRCQIIKSLSYLILRFLATNST
jgi:hypothetical protein